MRRVTRSERDDDLRWARARLVDEVCVPWATGCRRQGGAGLARARTSVMRVWCGLQIDGAAAELATR